MEIIGLLAGVGSYLFLGLIGIEIFKIGVNKSKENKKK